MNLLKFKRLSLLPLLAATLSCTSTASSTDVSDILHDRSTPTGNQMIIDAHLHFQPFGGKAIPHRVMMQVLKDNGIDRANMFGIGQTLPWDSGCTYYTDCIEYSVRPTLQNDIVNANMASVHSADMPDLTVSMTFMDLERPKHNLILMRLLNEHEYGTTTFIDKDDMFQWAGEVNAVKQAIFPNGHRPVTKEAVKAWRPFMDYLKDKNIPLSLHIDLGIDIAENEKHHRVKRLAENTKYLYLFEFILDQYPDNTIIWQHMGLSRELTQISPEEHLNILGDLFKRYPNLHADLSWSVLYDVYFKNDEYRKTYADFLNKEEHYPRFITGTDFVASINKCSDESNPSAATCNDRYLTELKKTSYINCFLNDEAFRAIVLGENYYRLLDMYKVIPQVKPGYDHSQCNINIAAPASTSDR